MPWEFRNFLVYGIEMDLLKLRAKEHPFAAILISSLALRIPIKQERHRKNRRTKERGQSKAKPFFLESQNQAIWLCAFETHHWIGNSL